MSASSDPNGNANQSSAPVSQNPSSSSSATLSVTEAHPKEEPDLEEKEAASDSVNSPQQNALVVDSREFGSPLDAALHCLWVLQRLSYFEPWREGMPADGFRFREVIRESRKLLNSLGYEPGTWNEREAPSVSDGGGSDGSEYPQTPVSSAHPEDKEGEQEKQDLGERGAV